MIPALLSFLGGVIGNVANSSAVRRNNSTNIQLARERNAMQQRESELAYQRSKSVNQVQNLMAAGMSKAGALNTLNGGGSYTPAPMQSAKTDAPQVDTQHLFDGLMTTWENNKSRKAAEKLQAEQIAHDRRTHARDLDHQKELKEMELKNAKEIAQMQSDSSKYSADLSYKSARERLNLDETKFNYFKSAELKQIYANIDNATESSKYSKEQREHLHSIKSILKETAQETLNKIKDDITDASFMRNIELRKLAIEKIKAQISAEFGSVQQLRESIQYWKNADSKLLYKGVGWYNDASNNLMNAEKQLEDYLNDVSNLLDAIDKLEAE